MNLENRMPIDIVPGLWDDLGSLAESGRLVSHREVFEEIQHGSGFLVDWSKLYKEMFLAHTPEQAGWVKEIIRQFPGLAGATKTYPAEADAWLIALSLCANRAWIVVTDESPKPEKRKIPTACQAFGVTPMNGFQLLRAEQWQYVRRR